MRFLPRLRLGTLGRKLRAHWKRYLLWSCLLFVGGVAALAVLFFLYAGIVATRIDERMAQLRSSRSTQFFGLYPPFQVGQKFTLPLLKDFLVEQGYQEARSEDDVGTAEFFLERGKGEATLTLARPAFTGAGHPIDAARARIEFEEIGGELFLKRVERLDTKEPQDSFENVPKKIGSYFAGRVRTQNSVPLSDIPTTMRLAVMAIEDVHFLEHSGVSVRSTARALYRDVLARKFVEGGSTITQQLMKNLFLSREKALSRKLKEAIYALIAEWRHDKETILEGYLNEVYLGQWGPHEIHGVSEGAAYYFARPVAQISLGQSATLAAIIQAPNTQDPHRFPDRTTKRRNLVLKKMLDAGFILKDEYDMAAAEPLGVVPLSRSLNDVNYFLELLMDRLPVDVQARLDKEALTIYTSLNPYLQTEAARALVENVERLKKLPAVQAQEKKGNAVQGALIAIDPRDCTVLAVQGGQSYRKTQFNRVLRGKRQPGSLFKPFVFLAGFAHSTSDDPITPLTLIDDAEFEWAYDKQTWKPRNYDNEFKGPVTLREALENSRNIPTVKLAQKVGVDAIVDVMAQAGIISNIPHVPSISLGSAEVTPLELSEAYTTIARLGERCALRPWVQVFDENKNYVADNKLLAAPALPPGPTFQTVHVLKGVFTHGTARGALSSGLALNTFAGKTGTTNEGNDAWFVGFSPSMLVLVWVGFDETAKLGLTGGAAALPAWTNFMKAARPFLTSDDFKKPDGLEPFDIDRKTNKVAEKDAPEIQVEYLVPGTEPK